MLRNPTSEQILQLAEERITKSGGTDEERATALGTTRPTLDRWRKAGLGLRLEVVAALAQQSGEAIVLRFDPDPQDIAKQAPRPEWAEGLLTVSDVASVIDALAKSGVLDSTARALIDAVLAALVPRLADAPVHETPQS